MARHMEMFQAAGGDTSGLEARLEGALEQKVILEEFSLAPDCSFVVEFVPVAEDAVVTALTALGVAAAECAVLTDLAQACAAVSRYGAPADQGLFTLTGADRTDATGSGATTTGAAGSPVAGPTGADATDTGPADPGLTDPGAADPTAAESAATDPSHVDPGATVPGVGEEAPAVKGRASSLVDALGTLSRAAGRLERVMVSGTRELTAAQGKLLLADKGVTDLEELTPAQREAWRAKAKRQARTDLELEMGWGAGEVRDLVALAGMPTSTTGPVGSAMATGEVSWKLVRGFIGAAGHLPTHLAGGVANALFGSDESVAATERLTSDREFTGRPWAHREFYRALDREVAKAEAHLDEDERRAKSRAKSLAEMDTWGRMDEDGTGTLGVRCTATQVAAILDRVEGAARRARSNGDQRSLGQIRSAVVATLLLKGTVTLPDLDANPDLITPEQTEQLAAILAGLPAAVLNVIVPLNLLHPDDNDPDGEADPDKNAAGEPGDGPCTCAQAADPAGADPAAATPDAAAPAEGCGADDHVETDAAAGEDDCADGSTGPAPGPGQDPASSGSDPGEDSARDGGQDSAPDGGEDSAPDGGEDSAPGAGGHGPDCACSMPQPGRGEDSAQPRPPRQGRFGSGVFGIGEVQGRRSFFLSPQEVTRLALTPGSVMHRLLTDPVTGRCLERSTTSYPFTKAMKTQIAFADGSCRVPGCVIPGVLCQFDHVTEHGTPGGETREANGALAHGPHHDQKTKQYLDAVINDRREMTWETLLGKIYRSKAHDYTQYSTLLAEAVDQVNAADQDDRAEALDLAIYQAMSYRPGTGRLVAEDDELVDDHRFQSWDRIRLTRRNLKTGRLVNGANPKVVKTERARHTRAAQAAAGEHPGPEGTDGQVTAEDTNEATNHAETPERGPWAASDDTPPPF